MCLSKTEVLIVVSFILASTVLGTELASAAPQWPLITREAKPWAYNWWMASAVDREGLEAQCAAMEEAGLGRPSTYAPTITNILGKHYITKEGRNLFVTELGETVNSIMEKSFPDIVDLNFTAEMETKLDRVAEGSEDWRKMMQDFYPNFEAELKTAEKELEKVTVEDEKTDVICDLCGRNMVIKYGPHGKFLACPGFPECRNTKQFLEKTGALCPKCGKEIVVRRSRKGRRFYGCSGAPECDYMSWTKPKA